MSISSSLNAGVMGLNVNAARLATISNNVANANTFGYKRAQANFTSLVLEQRRNAFAAGGVRVETTKLVDERGSLISTGSSTDLAVGGQGMMPVTNLQGTVDNAASRSLLFAPTGQFAADEDGFLRTPGGLYLLGWPADANGDIGGVSRRTGISLEPVNVSIAQFSAEPTTDIQLGVNLPSTDTEAGQTGDPYVLPIEYFDNLGTVRQLEATFTPTVAAAGSQGTNEWTIDLVDQASIPPASVGTLTVRFNDTPTAGGTIATVSAGGGASYDEDTGDVALALESGPVNLNIGRPGTANGLTQLSASFSPFAVAKNGAPIGDLSTVEVDSQGRVEAVYDTGFRRTLYQIPLGMVPNLNGLTAVDDQAYQVGQDSGEFFLWDAGDGPTGSIVGFALMESTTDIGVEMTDLIRTQRAYSSNAKIIQTVDEILQETTNIIR